MTNTMTQNQTADVNQLPVPEGLSEQNARKYLVMRDNLSLLKDETGTHLRNTILNDYYLELLKSKELAQAHAEGVKEERERIAKGFEPVRKDFAACVQTLNKRGFPKTARELRDNLAYTVDIIAGYTEADAINRTLALTPQKEET